MPDPNISALLGQLASGPPVGAIPTTPYASVNVAPLQLQQPITGVAPPKPIYPKPFNPFAGGGIGAGAGPGGGPIGTGPGGLGVIGAGGKGEEHGAGLLRNQDANPYYAQNVARALANQGITPQFNPAAFTRQQAGFQQPAPLQHPALQQPTPASLLHLMGNPAQSNLGHTLLQLGAPPSIQQQILQSLAQPEVYHGGAG